MAETQIEWTDATWNPVAGCSIVSADEKRSFCRKGSREFPMRSEASHEILNSPRMLAARSVDRRAAHSPTTMRWGSFAYFAL